MINSAEEFVRLRNSEQPEEYSRAVQEEAPNTVWFDVISRFPEMREWVVHNKTIPLEILEVLARDEEAAVRATVAEKRKLSPELFNLLANDSDELVRQRVAFNGKVPADLLERLSGDASPLVRAAALQRLGRA